MTKVLLLEDQPAVAESVIAALELRRVEVVHAATVKAAMKAYEPDLFDVIVLDYELPDGTGLDFLAGVRGTDKAQTVLYSGLDRSVEVAASGLHVDWQISKADPFELLEVVEGARDG